MFLVDSHCHLDLLNLTERADGMAGVLAAAEKQDVKHCLNVCINFEHYAAVLQTAKAHATVSASVGVHPTETTSITHFTEQLLAFAKDDLVIAIGETGLDYLQLDDQERAKQQERFRQHIQVAKQVNKPLIIHMRAARDDVLAILQEEEGQSVGGIMHCFTEDWETAKRALAMNFYISFSGIITFRNATPLQAVATKIPLDRLLLETDAPYLAPHPLRGKPNEPAYLRHTAQSLADLRHLPLEQLAQQTTHNFFTLFPRVASLYV